MLLILFDEELLLFVIKFSLEIVDNLFILEETEFEWVDVDPNYEIIYENLLNVYYILMMKKILNFFCENL